MKTIKMNQLGFAESMWVRFAVTSPEPVIITDREGNEIRRIENLTFCFDPSSGDRTAKLTVAGLPCGDYRIVQGDCSEEFSVQKTPYRDVLNGLIKGMYFQRCGCDLPEKYAGKYMHAACHTGPQRLYTDPDVIIEAHGGWHDAGDFGKYIAPGAVAVAHMLYAYRLFPEVLTDELNIPESGNGIPDILNECAYELRWMLKMQREDGALYHKLTKKNFADFIMPEDDHGQEYILPPAHCATGAHAGACALAYRIYRPYDPAFAETLLESARKAYVWLDANEESFEGWRNPADVRTGEYGDDNYLDEFFFAASELYAATGEEKYREKLVKLLYRVDLSQMGWREVGGIGAFCCLFELEGKLPEGIYEDLKRRFLLAADQASELSHRSGYGTALDPENYIWGSILPILGNAMVLGAAYLLTNENGYLYDASYQFDYLLGLNALDVSFVTGYGARPFMNPHHRPSASDGIDDPVPGLVSGGPNKKNPYGITKEKLAPTVYPAKYWLDETPLADQNEIAIYWNSPAIFVAALCDWASRREN